jgi:hypothetical protein
MAALSVNKSTVTADKPKNEKNTLALKKINDAWKGNGLEAARTAAFDIGMSVAGSMLAYDKARDNIRRGFEVRLIDDKWRSTVNEPFESGRSSLVTTAELHARFFSPVPANDNAKDDTISAETLLGMEFAPLEYVIPGYVVEGLTVLGGKPKLGKPRTKPGPALSW